MLESISHEGRLRFNKDKPYTPEMLHNIFFTAFNDLETTKECLKELEDMDLIKWEKDKTLYIKGVEERIGITSEQAEYMREYRSKKDNEKLQESLQCKPPVRNCNQNVITNVSLDIEKDIDKDIEKEIFKEKENINNLQDFLQAIEIMLGKALTGKNADIACKIYDEYGYRRGITEIEKNIDKVNPIAYSYKVLQNPIADESGSEWLDNLKKGMR